MTPLRLSASLLRALPLLAALAGCANPADTFDFDTCGVRPRAQIPVEMRGNIPLMRAFIKDKPATFVLDTGAVGVAITEQAAARFELGVDDKTVMVGSGVGGQSRGFAGKLERFRIGDLPVPNHSVNIIPASAGISQSGMVDGLFGVSVLSVFEVELDLPRRMVTLYGGRLCPTTLAPPWAANAVEINAGRSERGRFYVPVVIDGKPVNALLDTGAAISIISSDIARQLGVTQDALERDQKIRLSGTGPATAIAYVHRFRDIIFGGQTFPGPTLVVTERPDVNTDMIIGSDYLAHRRVWLSYARKRVFIERASLP